MAGREGGFRSLLVGIDGSREARQAVYFTAALMPPPGGRVMVLRVLEPVRHPSIGLLPAAVRARIEGEASRVQAGLVRTAQREVDRAVERLTRSGWRARGEVLRGAPVAELLAAIPRVRADLLIVGARGVGRVERFLLGSVADALVKQAPIPVLVVR